MGSTLKLKWLKENILTLPAESAPQQLVVYCKAYILGLISGGLMPDKSRNKIQLIYLPLLVDLNQLPGMVGFRHI